MVMMNSLEWKIRNRSAKNANMERIGNRTGHIQHSTVNQKIFRTT